jgi:hypothetical protein
MWSNLLERWLGEPPKPGETYGRSPGMVYDLPTVADLQAAERRILSGGDPRQSDDFFQTYTGKRFYLNDPQVKDVDVRDVVYAICGMPRYGCHGKRRNGYSYTVGEHSILLAWYTRYVLKRSRADVKHALCHDAGEFATGDIKRPIKNARPEIREAVRKIEDVTAEALGVPAGKPDWLADIDLRIVADEKPVVMGPLADGGLWGHEVWGVVPLGVPIRFISPGGCEALFWDMWEWCNEKG